MKYFSLSLSLLFSNLCFAQHNLQLQNKDSLQLKAQNCKKITVVGAIAIPTFFIGYGIIAQGNNGLRKLDKSTHNSIITNHPGYKTKVDNYIQFTPAVAVYGLNALGIKGKNNFVDRTMIYALSNIVSTVFSYTLKHTTKVTRPDGSANNSFPSGHTTTAFAAAAFLHHEYKKVSPWIAVAGYAAATTTSILRVYNNKHWVSDVVAGAGFGILSTKLAYLVYPAIKRNLFKKKTMNAMIIPYYKNGGGGFALVYSFKK
ncbi:MAG: phosphatase PAP2 family protein [Ferruginibacter sp.]